MSPGKEASLPSENRREGNLELLRIVCMLMIIAHHMCYHGGVMQSDVWGNKVLGYVLFSGGQTGVNCFVMITGYCLAGFRARRFFSTILETAFYSLGLTLLMLWTGLKGDIPPETVRDSLYVISRSPYWFVVMYLGLTAVLPLLQPGVKGLSRNAHRWVLAFGTAYLCVVPTLTVQNPSSQYFHQFTWFLYLYCLGAYFKKYPGKPQKCLPLHGAVFAGMIALMTAIMLWGEGHQDFFQRVAGRQNFAADKNVLPQLICTCALFKCFTGIKVKPYKLLTLLSGASFGVYLIHDHVQLRGYLWKTILSLDARRLQSDFWVTALLAPPAIYLCCAAIDCVRKYVLEKPLLKALDPVFREFDGWLAK